MADDISGKGDPIKTLKLLWGKAPAPRRGPKAKLALADLVTAAVAIADRDGLDALTTRRVADEVGIAPMSVYTYVPGKDELLDLMLDAVLGEVRPPRGATWRDKLADVARQNWDLALRHPWMHEIATHRPVLGPKVFAKYDAELSAVDGIGLTDLEMNNALTLVLDYVAGAVRGAARETWVKQRTGMTDDEWWKLVEPHMAELYDPVYPSYPLASRIGQAFGEAHGAHDPEGSFAFGLERVLDGIAVLVDRRAAPAKKKAPRPRRR